MSQRIDTRYKSARDIERMLRNWVLDGRMVSKTSMGCNYGEINRKYATSELLVTDIDGIDVTDKIAQQALIELHKKQRVMTKREVMLNKGYTTEYQIKQSVKKGELLKFDLLGRSAILYIE